MEKAYAGTCELLDKITLKSLHLMEEKLEGEIALEAVLNEGTLHLAKSRYIMGQNRVSSVRLPTEDSSEFRASLSCVHEDYGKQSYLKICEYKGEDTVNAIKWFGVLVPQNLHRAQKIFRRALDYVVACANSNIQLATALQDIELLRENKNKLAQSAL